MINTTIDIVRLPVDKNGDMVYDFEDARHLLETYQKTFPDRSVILMPSNISVWEDLDIDLLIYYRDKLNELIEMKQNV